MRAVFDIINASMKTEYHGKMETKPK